MFVTKCFTKAALARDVWWGDAVLSQGSGSELSRCHHKFFRIILKP